MPIQDGMRSGRDVAQWRDDRETVGRQVARHRHLDALSAEDVITKAVQLEGDTCDNRRRREVDDEVCPVA
ncbi:hypothetical protein GCM10027169_33780 [Gordonia jinhuaensis]|uniref:Uncharacterized protein n=1 Tax=Gordonia jinhuaensis TaxID=1517702 RepID=A0A916WTB3_9ACTN|nr:hypothetical protein GCM10011489_14990 [Gordonia jinhuaensis]